MSLALCIKVDTITRVAALGCALWREIQDIARAVVKIDNDDDREAYMNELDELDPNSRQGLAWRMIKAWANDPVNDWLEHM